MNFLNLFPYLQHKYYLFRIGLLAKKTICNSSKYCSEKLRIFSNASRSEDGLEDGPESGDEHEEAMQIGWMITVCKNRKKWRTKHCQASITLT
jgi:hypothetical protein